MRATCASASTCCPASSLAGWTSSSARRRSTRIPRCACGRSSSSRRRGRASGCGGRGARQRPRPLRDPAERRAAAAALGPRGSWPTDRACSSRSSTIPIRRCGRRRSTPWCPRTPASRRSSVGSSRRSRSPAPRAARPPRSGGSATRPSLCSRPRSPATDVPATGRSSGARPPLRRSTALDHRAGARRPRPRGRARGARRAGCGRGGGVVPPSVLDGVFDDAAAHASRASLPAPRSPATRLARRALEDESDLARRLVIAVLALRHGDRVRDAVRVVDRAEGQRRALGVEALDVIISRDEAAVALPLVRRDLTPDERAAGSAARRAGGAPPGRVDRGHGGRSGAGLALLMARPVRPPRRRAMSIESGRREQKV